jgi:transcriptional/translational regulatory protein YebC/TACO1
MEEVRKTIEEGRRVISAEVALVPKTTVELDEDKAAQALKFLDQLDELDDVQHVYSNIDFSDATLEKLHSRTD